MDTIHRSGRDKDTDAELVAAAKCGDVHAFEKLVLRHERKVLAAAQRITNNREDAEDVVQESFHKAFLRLDSFQEESRFTTWLRTIVMNEAFMLLRRRRRIFEVLPDGHDDDLKFASWEFIDQGPNPEQSCWRSERMEILTEAIHRLGPKIQETMLLHNLEEHSIEKTARILGTSKSAVKSLLFRGRRLLRGVLNPELLHGPNAAGPAGAQRC
jgi:RNA polymerase sigma-70 factor (ECF subfamily)